MDPLRVDLQGDMAMTPRYHAFGTFREVDPGQDGWSCRGMDGISTFYQELYFDRLPLARGL